MKSYKRHRFPPDIISYAVWLYHRFNLSQRDIEDLLSRDKAAQDVDLAEGLAELQHAIRKMRNAYT